MHTQTELDRHFRKNINFRDLGAYTGADGRRIKPGLLYRSGGLYFMNEEELAFFRTLGVRYVMDLRTRAEADAQPDPVLDGITYLQHSGLEFSTAKEIDFVCAAFRCCSTRYIKLYDGVIDLLDTLKARGKRIYLLSNAQRKFTENLCKIECF